MCKCIGKNKTNKKQQQKKHTQNFLSLKIKKKNPIISIVTTNNLYSTVVKNGLVIFYVLKWTKYNPNIDSEC